MMWFLIPRLYQISDKAYFVAIIVLILSEICSVKLEKYLGEEEYKLKIKYGNKENQQMSFVKADDIFLLKMTFCNLQML